MPYEFKFPDVGEGITEGEIVKWLIKEGDMVKEDQTIAQIETDKSVADIPSPKTGKILKINIQEGKTVKVGEVLVVIGTKNDKVSKSPTKEEAPNKKTAKKEKKSSGAFAVGSLEEAEEETEMPQSHVNKKDTFEARVLASPAVRKLAKEKGIDLEKVKGSGPEGRVKKTDISKEDSPSESVPQQKIKVVKKYDSYGYLERHPLKGIRKVIAKNVKESQDTAAEVTSMDDIDVTKLWNLRKREKKRLEKKGVKLTFMPFIIKAMIAALKDNPILNSVIEGDEIIIKKYYNIGMAVDTEVGLMVPVIKIADSKKIVDIAKEIVELAEKARSRKIDLQDLQGSTITITNYGSVTGTYGTPILNKGNAAILGLGRIFDRPVVGKLGLTNRKMLPISLTFDHRILDGAQAANFIKSLKTYLEDPSNLLIES